VQTPRPAFGFESRAGQFTYPFLISFMLLVHRYVYPAYPEWRSAEFYMSMALLSLYIVSRKFITGQARARWGRQIRMMEKAIEVYIGVTVVASLIFTLIKSMFG
jgi:threonine/homoserine/homoserine lactone efflux protein